MSGKAKTEFYLKSLFRRYYRENPVTPPPSMEKREFGFMFFGTKAMARHLSFLAVEELQGFLSSEAPSGAFYSAAYYLDPSAPRMDEKGWIGCDLIFDIDADHLDLPCKNVHDKWACKSCGESGFGVKPERCPKCGSQDLNEKAWLCEGCLDAAKTELVNLIEEYLIPDFGIGEGELKPVFSGHRGYHLHVTSNAVLDLDQTARREIIDYIRGTGLQPRYHGLSEVREGRSRIIKGPSVEAGGWRGRLARGIAETILLMGEEDLPENRKLRSGLKSLLRNKGKVTASLRKGFWDPVKGVDISTWEYLAELTVKRVGGKIDEPVTADVRRLIRLPTSLHGKTGFRVTPLKVKDLNRFDPFKDALVFKGEIRVQVEDAPQFRIGEETFGPYKNEAVELPLSAAVFLMCKGAAYLK
nr:hypothetical protein [Candidatus Bathyarchaeota archaeon]